MKNNSPHPRIEYGDFQTPLELATQVCQKLNELGISPDIIIEPTCGIGNFIEASATAFPLAKKIIGIEINQDYVNELTYRKGCFWQNQRIELFQGDFFNFYWQPLFKNADFYLVLGNFPWVTNAQQSAIGGKNLPPKNNFQHYTALEAITGKSNFDISAWMLIQMANWLGTRKSCLAMLCKTAVARKFLSYLHSERKGVLRSAIYGIDAKRYFDVAVAACLLVCEFEPQSHHYDYNFYEQLNSTKSWRVGHRNGIIVRDLDTFEKLNNYDGQSQIKWRSGIKHDCADVMEFEKVGKNYINGLGETVAIEPTYIYPLLKGSDIANNRLDYTNRYVLVPQKKVGEATIPISQLAPKTWDYLISHADYLDRRKSKIYQATPRFSVFGVGSYTFMPYKIAISGLYKQLDFRLVHQIEGKPVVFDDTVYFLSCHTEQEANQLFNFLTSSSVKDFYSALIFWDEKRPIKSGILNRLNLPIWENKQAYLFPDK